MTPRSQNCSIYQLQSQIRLLSEDNSIGVIIIKYQIARVIRILRNLETELCVLDMETQSYTNNDLHEALMRKNCAFCKCWHSKFEQSKKCTQVNGYVDPKMIVDKFAQHFEKSYSCNNRTQAIIIIIKVCLHKP